MFQTINGNYVIQGEILHLLTSDLNPFTYIVIDDVVGFTIFMSVFYLFVLMVENLLQHCIPRAYQRAGLKIVSVQQINAH